MNHLLFVDTETGGLDQGRLTDACAALGVDLPADQAHTALSDALASARLYTRLLELVR